MLHARSEPAYGFAKSSRYRATPRVSCPSGTTSRRLARCIRQASAEDSGLDSASARGGATGRGASNLRGPSSGTASIRGRGCSSMVEPQPSKLITRVRFPPPASSDPLRLRRMCGGPIPLSEGSLPQLLPSSRRGCHSTATATTLSRWQHGFESRWGHQHAIPVYKRDSGRRRPMKHTRRRPITPLLHQFAQTSRWGLPICRSPGPLNRRERIEACAPTFAVAGAPPDP